MTTINKDFGSGGSPLNPAGGGQMPSLMQTLQDVADDHAVLGLLAYAPTNASTQSSGTGNIDWNINLSVGEVALGGYWKQYDIQADFDVLSGTWIVNVSQSVYARLVAKLVGTTISLQVVFGVAAATGSEVAPTDAAVQAAVGSGNKWCDVALLHMSRDSGTTLAQTQQNSYRTKTLKGTTNKSWL